MKHWKTLLLGGLSTMAIAVGVFLPQVAQAKDVSVTLPAFPVEINGIVQDQTQLEYPFIVYNDITYVPMTYFDARLLGLSSSWSDESGLSIVPLSFIPDGETARSNYQPYVASTPNQSKYTAALAQFAISVNGNAITNSEEEYPLLVFRDVTYFPLTWRFAVDEFGWEYTFESESGLKITPIPTKIYDQFAGIINGSVVNVRSGPGTDTEVVSQVKQGAAVTVYNEEKNDKGELWYAVVLSDGKTGYVASWLLVRQENYNQTTSTAPSSPTITGEINDFALLDVDFGERESSVRYDIGSNEVSATQPDAKTVRFLVNNNIVPSGINDIAAALSGPLVSLRATQVGANCQIDITMKDGAYCQSYVENEALTITVRERDYLNTNLHGKVIVIDPGHGDIGAYGDSDPGAIGGLLGYTDREVGTHVGNKLKTLLENAGATVILTRTEEPILLSLTDRSAISNQNNADLFISIHGNAMEDTSKQGAETYYYSGAAALNPQGQSFIRKELAQYVSDGIGMTTGRSSVVKSSNYAVIRETYAPCLLVECGYLSNMEDEILLSSDSYQSMIATGIYYGITQYFSAY